MKFFTHEQAIAARGKHLATPRDVPFFGELGAVSFEDLVKGLINHTDHGGEARGRCVTCSTGQERVSWDRWGDLMVEMGYRFFPEAGTSGGPAR